MIMVTYCPLSSNHPSASNDFPVLPYSSEGISRIFKSQSEAVGYLGMRGGVRGLALARERLKVLYRGGVFIGRISEYNDI